MAAELLPRRTHGAPAAGNSRATDGSRRGTPGPEPVTAARRSSPSKQPVEAVRRHSPSKRFGRPGKPSHVHARPRRSGGQAPAGRTVGVAGGAGPYEPVTAGRPMATLGAVPARNTRAPQTVTPVGPGAPKPPGTRGISRRSAGTRPHRRGDGAPQVVRSGALGPRPRRAARGRHPSGMAGRGAAKWPGRHGCRHARGAPVGRAVSAGGPRSARVPPPLRSARTGRPASTPAQHKGVPGTNLAQGHVRVPPPPGPRQGAGGAGDADSGRPARAGPVMREPYGGRCATATAGRVSLPARRPAGPSNRLPPPRAPRGDRVDPPASPHGWGAPTARVSMDAPSWMRMPGRGREQQTRMVALSV